jgi:CheY-like chemotaxis protein
VFTLRFPIAGTAAVTGKVPPASMHGAGTQVLVIEDNHDVREMMSLLLSEHGFVVRTAEDGRTGIASAATSPPEVALVDIDLPDMSGYDIAMRLRSSPACAGIGLVAVTGYGQAVDREKALAAGFDAHLTKPVPIEELVAAIHRLVGQESPAG